ncbi:uncharacterized protein SCHCODRAFT_02603826 [Schizophyllum commune H4-8]|uniref:Uncharacterized protein n=1 Tax=Schizophyllum commune (strain H4-8 / FGSC 9210) TaxID=578458 RepID=D8QM62_SCHCM|nr:uncharacterized protein SCHCODRAFT_02603826 [Schizophyllum commune H4-8]KAI5836644.1 hypothetical protein SCHCODRAFT_02603826 [Schizophyllum commune H4-8]
MDRIISASDEPGDHDTSSDIEVSGSSVRQLQDHTSHEGDLLDQVQALSLSIRRLEKENWSQGRELSSLMDDDDAEHDRFRRAIVTKNEEITALQATADSLQRRWQEHVAGQWSESASVHPNIGACPAPSREHYNCSFPPQDREKCMKNRDTWRIILSQLKERLAKRLECAEARAQHCQQIISRIQKEISLVQPSALSCILANPIADRGPSTSALEVSDGSVKEPVKVKKNANKIAKQRNENTARNHCLRDWLQDHPRGTNGQFDAHWRNIRANADLLKPYQDRARKDVVVGKAKLNHDKPAKLSGKNTARYLFRQITQEGARAAGGDLEEDL